MTVRISRSFLLLLMAVLLVGVSVNSCRRAPRRGGGIGGSERGDVQQAALKTYVAPGDMDEYYLFYSGGHSGQVFVAGVPSMRHITTIPVFTPYPGTGYGFDKNTKQMLGNFTWGDAHHPALSETNGDYDGRWLFINDNANNRFARIDLRDFKTRQILGPIPNLSGFHGGPYVTQNTEYAWAASRFSVPIPKGTYATIDDYKSKFHGVAVAVAVDQKTGNMSLAWEVLLPPFNFDLADSGKKVSHGWVFWTCYNSERATGKLEETASQKDRDYIVAINWKEAEKVVAAGKVTTIDGVKVIDPRQAPGVAYLIPCPKSPHGVDVSPDGRYIVGSGKLAAVAAVFDFQKFQDAIGRKDFVADEDGIPVVKYESVKVAEVPVGLGPLHTQFDDQGNAYTSLFVDSAIAKWKLGTWEVADKIPVAYNIGHLCAAHGDTVSPQGKYLIALNKISRGRHLPVGPSIPESSQLVDITGEKMKLLYDAFTEAEPHYATMIKADRLKVIETYTKADNTNPNATWDQKDAGVVRATAGHVEVKIVAVRSTFYPQRIEVNEGDLVTLHVTNIEETRDELHGLSLGEHNINIVVDPGETKTIEFVANKPGVYPYYCSNFCSALHQEMQGYLFVKPKAGTGAKTASAKTKSLPVGGRPTP